MTSSYRHRTEGKCQAVTLESVPAQQSDKKKKIQAPRVRQEGWVVQKQDDTPQMYQDRESSVFPGCCFTATRRINVQKINLGLVGKCWLARFAWDCSESQNLPKMKETVPDSHPAAEAAAEPQRILCCKKSLSQNASPSISISKHLFP